jgi:hypothetical protein
MTEAEPILYALRILAENEGMEKAQVMRQFNGYVC